jgi:hypothetical protein
MDTHCLLLIPIQIKRKLVISELVNPKTASEKVNIFIFTGFGDWYLHKKTSVF